MAQLSAFLGVSRAPFLLLPVTLVVCGAGAGFFEGAFSWPRTVIALVGLVALHMAVNIFNEVSDFKTGIDFETEATPFSGGSGTLPGGAMTSRTAAIFGAVCAGVGAATGVWFVFAVGWPMLPLVAVGAVTVLAYTSALARYGVGELAAGLGLGALPVMGTALVQDGTLGPAAIAASLPAFFMTFNLLLLNEFPDETADRRGGRRNLVLLLGRPKAAMVYALAGLATPAWIAGAVTVGFLPTEALVATLPSLLLIGPLRWAFGNTESNPPIPAMGANVAWNLLTNLCLGITLFAAA